MSYIYVITNNVNGKQYVGKTNKPIEKRFKEHLSDSGRSICEKRPLYCAIKKYGKKNFSIDLLETCLSEEAAIREQYWIDKINTYHDGYNATYGGDGKLLYDYQEIANKYLELQDQQATAKYFQCNDSTVRIACKECNVNIKTSQQLNREKYGIKIYCRELDLIFISIHEAASYLLKNNYTNNKSISSISKNITRSCKDDSHIKTAYKMHWQYL